jgi:hypothetical protein
VFERGGLAASHTAGSAASVSPLVLLEPDVVPESLAELAQRGRVGRLVDGERVGRTTSSATPPVARELSHARRCR